MGEVVSDLLKRVEELENENAILRKQHIDISQAKELYLKIFEEFPALIWRSGLDKMCNYFNKTWLDFTGRTMEQEYGNGWAEGVHPDDFDFCLNTYVTAFDQRKAFLMEYRMKNKLGEYKWIRDFGRPFFDLDNSFLGYIGSCYDITESKENELKLIELNATKDKFFSIIAHDLKGPFGSLIGLSEMLIETINTGDKEKIKPILSNITSLLNGTYKLLDNLLQWAQLQKGTLIPVIQYHNLALIVNELALLYCEKAGNKGITLQNNIDSKFIMQCDREMIKTILRNLISNAIKFTRNNGVVSINAQQNETCIEIIVEDTGVGIPDFKLENLFRIDKNTSSKGTANETGTGLGLVISKELAEKQGGKIKVTSELGKGSIFTVSLPL